MFSLWRLFMIGAIAGGCWGFSTSPLSSSKQLLRQQPTAKTLTLSSGILQKLKHHQPQRQQERFMRHFVTRLQASSNEEGDTEQQETKKKGDPLREATGIRPSLHPTTINAIAEALKLRAVNKDGFDFRVVPGKVEPIQVALTAGNIASSAIAKRQASSKEDGMTLTTEEEQTIAGRVLGVIMRLEDLEGQLWDRVSQVSWVAKYNEWETFGCLKKEKEQPGKVDETIKDDPLFAISRAECLLALFLQSVEIPQLEKVGQKVPDGSSIDFLDADRKEVLLTK